MKCLMYSLDDGVVIGSVSEKILAGMMGAGGLVKEGQIDREVAKFLMETKGDEALLKTSVPDLLTLKAGPYEVVVRAFVNGLCTGGLTEAEALRRIAAKDEPVPKVRANTSGNSVPPEKSDNSIRVVFFT